MTSINVHTKYNKDFIINEIFCDDNHWDVGLFAWVNRKVIDMQEDGIRQALIAMGWTPPIETGGGRNGRDGT